MNDLELFAKKIRGLKQVYLAGGIQNAAQPNSWRDILTRFFTHNGIKVFNPVTDNAQIFNQSVLGYKEDGSPVHLSELQDIDELKEAILYRQTELNDFDAIKKSDVVIFYLDSRIGHGTMKEFDFVYDTKKPMIIVRTIPRRELSHWTKWRRYFALVIDKTAIEFRSLTELKHFFVKYLGFKDDEQ